MTTPEHYYAQRPEFAGYILRFRHTVFNAHDNLRRIDSRVYGRFRQAKDREQLSRSTANYNTSRASLARMVNALHERLYQRGETRVAPRRIR